MNKPAKITASVVFSLFSQMAIAGPFGLNMGMTIKQIDTIAEQVAPSVYITSKVPKSHSAFENYGVKVGPKSGLCWIKAIGKDISTSSYGIDLNSEFEEMEQKLTKTYGKSEITDLLMPGSTWNEPNDFMMAMIKKERYLMAIWEPTKGSKLKGDLIQVGLIATASGLEKGYLSLEYSFSNKEACEKEIAALEDDAL